MTQFHSLLVGVDLEQTDPPGSSQFSPPVEEAIRTATWLAEKAKASLGFLGIELDEKRNAANESVISAAGRVAVRVIRTDEEQTIARLVWRVLGLGMANE